MSKVWSLKWRIIHLNMILTSSQFLLAKKKTLRHCFYRFLFLFSFTLNSNKCVLVFQFFFVMILSLDLCLSCSKLIPVRTWLVLSDSGNFKSYLVASNVYGGVSSFVCFFFSSHSLVYLIYPHSSHTLFGYNRCTEVSPVWVLGNFFRPLCLHF